MLDLKYIRENADAVKKGARDKRNPIDIDAVLRLDAEVRPMQTELERLQGERNRMSKEIGKAAPNERESMKGQVQEIKAQMETIESTLNVKKAELDNLLLLVPQPARHDVPIGKDDSENVEVKKWGTPPQELSKMEGVNGMHTY